MAERSDTVSKVERGIRLDFAIAVCAPLISSLAAGASWWQARVLQGQTQVLQEQLGAQVWPYVSLTESIRLDAAQIARPDGLQDLLLCDVRTQSGASVSRDSERSPARFGAQRHDRTEVSMKRSAISRLAATVGAAVMLVACGGGSGNGAAVPGAGSGMQAPSNDIANAAALNLSGEYSGTVKDTYYGKGTGSAFYAQHGSSVGGVFAAKFKKASFSISVALTVSGTTGHASTVGGSGSQYCTGVMSSKYDKKTHVVTGSYMTVYGCSGEKGTFSLKQQCYFKGSGNAAIRPETGSIKPC
jgi:hypothetical protein